MIRERRTLLGCLIVLIFSTQYCLAEIFSSIAQMETMITTERQLADKLDLYIAAQQERVEFINSYVSRLEVLAADAAEHGILHPAAAFLHTVALSVELDDLMNFLSSFQEPEQRLDDLVAFREQQTLPDKTDLKGAAIAIARLQDVYKITADQFAEGKLCDRPSNDLESEADRPSLTISDSFTVANQLFDAEQVNESIDWFDLVLERCAAIAEIELDEEDQGQDLDEGQDLECEASVIATSLTRIAYANYLRGNTTGAILQTAEALAFDETNQEALMFLKIYFGHTALENEDVAADSSATEEGEAQNKQSSQEGKEGAAWDPKSFYGTYNRDIFRTLCRADSPNIRDSKLDTNLRCRLSSSNDDFGKISPINVEELDNFPEVKVFRNFLSAAEADYLVAEGLKHLKRSTVVHPASLANSSKDEQEEFDLKAVLTSRTAKTAWLNHDHSDVTAAIIRRAQRATGLDLNNDHAEPMQMGNYGIGGHYDPHFDFFSMEHSKPSFGYQWKDERLATFMIYLTDVEEGGATVFVRRNLTVFPRKGDVLFWYNMDRDGNGHEDTLHAGCPVLLGSKWVMNLWIKADGQELIRPCGITSDARPIPIMLL